MHDIGRIVKQDVMVSFHNANNDTCTKQHETEPNLSVKPTQLTGLFVMHSSVIFSTPTTPFGRRNLSRLTPHFFRTSTAVTPVVAAFLRNAHTRCDLHLSAYLPVINLSQFAVARITRTHQEMR